jgi:hypothetical protein
MKWGTHIGRGLGIALVGALLGCSGGRFRSGTALPPLPPGGGALGAEFDPDRARQLYLNKCTRCHKFYPPAQYSPADWDRWMTKMSRKANLAAQQEQTLRRFLMLYRPSTPAPAPE